MIIKILLNTHALLNQYAEAEKGLPYLHNAEWDCICDEPAPQPHSNSPGASVSSRESGVEKGVGLEGAASFVAKREVPIGYVSGAYYGERE